MGPKKDAGGKGGGKGDGGPVWEELLKTMKTQAQKFEAPALAFNPILKIAQDGLEQGSNPPKRMIFASPVDPLWARVLMYSLVMNVKSFANLQSLCFWGCDLGDRGAMYVMSALHILPNIYCLHMTNCGIGPKGADAIGDNLCRQSAGNSLLILRLDHNKLGDDGAENLARGLGRSSELNTLSLAYCGIKGRGAAAISKGLGGSGKLRTLIMEGNEIGQDGMVEFSKHLLYNKTLTCLDLTSTHFATGGETKEDLRGVVALTQAIRDNKRLCKVNLDDNPLGNVGVQLMIKHLFEATHLMEVDITPLIDKAIYDAFAEMIKKNKPVKEKKGGKKGKGKK